MIDPGVAWDKLSNFETAEEIREYFQDAGIRAIRTDHRSCAIAQWLIGTTGIQDVSVAGVVQIGYMEGTKITASGHTMACVVPEYEFRHTNATLTFMEKFDEGAYPELDVYVL